MNAALPLATCKVCDKEFQRVRPLQAVCSFKCAGKLVTAKKQAEKEDRRATRLKLIALKPRSEWIKEAQQAFNYYVRMRDADLPCISCQKHKTHYDAGHFHSVGAHPELRFHLDNVHKQCVECNRHNHGRLLEYAKHLPERIGRERFEALNGPHKAEHYSVDELKNMRNAYRLLAKQLREGMHP